MLLILALSISASFASDNADSMQANDDIGQEPISVSDESMDDSSQADESLSAGVEVDGDKMNSVDDEILKEENVGTFTELNQTINNNTSNHIDLYKDYCGSDLYDGIVINRELTIDGHGHILDADNYGSIFTVKTTSKIVFNNLTFREATQSAITFEKDAHVDIINCNFLDNQRESKIKNSNLYGGAIDFKGNLANSRFINVTFARNGLFTWGDYSSVYGGAICVEKNANNNKFDNVLFKSNFCRDQGDTHTGGTYSDIGAGIAFLGTTDNNEFVNTTFTGNVNSASLYFTSEYNPYQSKQYGKGQGAGIHFSGESTNTHFAECLFENNMATAGGAIHFASRCENVKFLDSKFIGNDISRGDTEYNYYANPIQNEGEGGAIRFFNGVNVLFNNTLFDDNLGRYGGAIFIKECNNIVFTNVNFTENVANTDECHLFYGNQVVQPRGGAIYLKSGNDVSFDNIIFDGNKAYVEEAAYYDRYTIVEGGAIAIFAASNLVINNSVFNNNFAKNYGGAVYVSGITNCTFTNLNFTNNHLTSAAGASGGAFYSAASANDYNLTNINFIGNGITGKFSYYTSSSTTNTVVGGAAYLAGNNINVYNVNFTDNLLNAPCDSLKNLDICMGIVYLSGSNYTFDEVNFIGNKVQAPYNTFVGGSAIATYSTASGVNITNALFENNTSTGKGAIFIRGKSNYVFNNTEFIRNTGSHGAAIYATADNVTIVNSIFEDNTATISGSAIYLTGSYQHIDNVNFTDNKLYSNGETAEGGVLYLGNLKYSEIKNIDIINNKDDGTSAEVAAIYANNPVSVSFNNLNVINNTGYKSGVILLKTPSDVNISYANFVGNAISSTTSTSAVINTDLAINVDHCIFENNIVSTADIYHNAKNVKTAYMNIEYCTFKKSLGREIIYIYNTPAFISNSEFTGFNGEFVIYLYAKDSFVNDCNFTNNTCVNCVVSLNGYSANPTTFSNVNFINNTGGNMGGAIYTYNAGLNLNDVYFENNRATGNGGTLYIGSSTRANLNHVTIKDGTTYGDGGAIYMESSAYYLNIYDSTIENCRASSRGGAIYASYCSGGNNEFYNVTFNNNAAYNGGAIYMGGYSYFNIYESTFTNNTAVGSAGAISINNQAHVTIETTNFTQNRAAYGSAIDNDGSLTISDSVFLKNKASSTELIVDFNRYTDETTSYYVVGDNYINAIRSSNDNVAMDNVTYFEYEGNTIFNTNDRPAENNYYKANQTFTITFYDKNNTVISKFNKTSDMDGRLYLNSAPYGKHHLTIERFEDDYYTYVEGTGLCIWGDFTILQRLIDALDDNGVLTLNRTYIYTLGADDITEGIVINKTNITINANGYAINALFQSRVFQVLTNGVKFQNIHFVNASGLEGAFIYGIGVNNTEIINCSFENSFDFSVEDYPVYPPVNQNTPVNPDPGGTRGDIKSPSRGGYDPYDPQPDPIDESVIGGAVYIIGNNLDVINSNFTRLIARLGAGVYFEGVNATFTNSRFNNTKAGYGGAICLVADDVVIDNCNFYNNTAQLAGGAIIALGNNYSVFESTFTYCHIVEDKIDGIGNIDDRIMQFANQNEPDPDPVTPVDPGTIKSPKNENLIGESIGGSENSQLEPTYIDEHVAGGAICSDVSNINIAKSSFISCSAYSFGGAIFTNGNNTVIEDSEFISCNATSGGAVLVCILASNSTVTNCTFDSNVAWRNGGAISWYAENGTLSNSAFNNNHQYFANMDFDNYYYEAYDIRNGGGAVYWWGWNASVDNCNFTNNTVCIPFGDYIAQIKEMGLEEYDTYYLIFRLLGDSYPWGNFDDDEVEYRLITLLGGSYSYGGAFLIRGCYINITNCNFNDNFAQTGGAIAIADSNYPALAPYNVPTDVDLSGLIISDVVIDNCNFINNFAQYAGAVSLYGYKNNIYNSNFINNTALVGGALNLQGMNSTVSNVTFIDNGAYVAGAVLSGMYIDGGSGYYELSGFNNMINNSTFINNYANGAGAVLWLDENGIINGSHFKGNKIANVFNRYSERFNDCYSLNINETVFMDLVNMYPYYMVVPNMVGTMDYAGAVFWRGDYGLINSSDFTQNNATFAGALVWEGWNGVVNNSEFTKNTAVRGNAIFWLGEEGTLDNSIIKDNYGLETVEGQPQKTVFIYTVEEEREEYYRYTYDYDAISLQKYNDELLPQLRQIYGWDISLVGFYYNKVYTRSVSYSYYRYSYYNVTFNYILLVDSYDGINLGPCSGAVYWTSSIGLINNTQFINNKNLIGGGLYVEGQGVAVANSNFINNSANMGGAIYWCGDWGAVYNSTFKDNHAFAVEESAAMINYTYLAYNHSFKFNGSDYNIKSSSELFDGMENAINDIARNYELYGLEFNGYTFGYVENDDGTYDVNVVYSFTVIGVVELQYPSPDFGGAIYCDYDNFLIMDSEFINNSAFFGAAVYMQGYYDQIINSTFKNNLGHDLNQISIREKQRYVGYDIYSEGYGYSSEVDCDFFVNSNLVEVIENVTKLYDYDAIRYEGYSFEVYDIQEPAEQWGKSNYKVKMTLVFSLIDYDQVNCPSASCGAAVYINGEDAYIDQSSFIDNSASCGGAVYVNAERTVIYNSTFDGNVAYKSSTVEVADEINVISEEVTYYRDYSQEIGPKYGISDAYKYMLGIYDKYDADEIRVSYTINGYYYGGDMIGYELDSIYYEVTLITYANKTLTGSFGGSVYVNAPDTTIDNVTFVNNYAEYGGAIYTCIDNTQINQAVLNSNNAEYGGALYTDGVYTTINNSTFELNHGYIGGAVYWNNNDGYVIGSNFFNNTAHNAGAIFYRGNNNTIQDNSVFKYNVADTGSALYVEGTGLEIKSSTLLENQAKSSSIQFIKNVSQDNTLTVHIVFRGNDNFINAMYVLNNVSLEDVTYCPIGNNANPKISSLEDGININIKLSDSESILTYIYNLTDINGEATIIAPNLHYGRYLFTVEHEEDNYYTEITKTEIIYVGSASTPLEVISDDIFYGQNATVEVRVPLGISGDFVIEIDGRNYTTVFIDKYIGRAIVPNLEGGLHTVKAYFEGNNIYSANSSSTTFTVKPIPTSIVVSSKDVHHGEEIPIDVVLGDENVSGKVLITIEEIHGITLEITDSNHLSTFVGTLDVGTYHVSAFYIGDNNYLNASDSTNFTVMPNKINANVISYDISSDENPKFVISIPTDFVGKVDISVDGISRTYDVSGSKVIVFDKLGEGKKSANLSFYGNINYIDESVIVNFTVSKPEFVTGVYSVHAFDMTRSANSPYDYQAAFLNSNGEVLANAPVAFKVNGVTYQATTNNDGIAQLSLSQLPAGKYNVTSINLATGDEVTMELEVVGRIYENRKVVMDFMDGTYFVVKVLGDDGNPAPEGEIVSITANGVGYVAKVGKNGYARLKINLNPNKYTVVTEYKGFKTTDTLIVKQTLKLVKKTVKVKKSAKSFKLKATLKWSNGKAIVGEKVKFIFKGKTYVAKTNKNGLAKVKINKKVIKKLKKGKTYRFTVKYFTNAIKGSVKVKK